MKKLSAVLLSILLLFGFNSCVKDNSNQSKKYGLVIHAGAGSIVPGRYSPEQEEEFRLKLNEALEAGYKILEEEGSSLDAVEAAINIMEDSPFFNAGKGAVFTADEKNELDASIMNGDNLEAGAVARLRHIKNPISLARAVMEKSKHVFMAGDGAEKFAVSNGFEMVDSSYFFTQERWESLQNALKKEKKDEQASIYESDFKYGTVGAAALDKNGNLAAGTSTGGMTNKKYGRIGDSPIIGAGTYADNKTCAVSATGHGEYFIRLGIARDVASMMEYQFKSLHEAADEVIHIKLEDLGGTGGIIAIDKDGNVAMPFNTPGMFRGYKLEGEDPVVLFFQDNQ